MEAKQKEYEMKLCYTSDLFDMINKKASEAREMKREDKKKERADEQDAKAKLPAKERANELRHASEMFELEQRKKELSNPSTSPAAAIPPAGHITVRKVYLENREAFKVGPDRENFLKAAGKIAKEAYTAKHWFIPPVIQEGPFKCTATLQQMNSSSRRPSTQPCANFACKPAPSQHTCQW